MLNIKTLKQLTGLNQTQIAEKLNVSPTFLSQNKNKSAFWMDFVTNYEKEFGEILPITKFIKDERN